MSKSGWPSFFVASNTEQSLRANNYTKVDFKSKQHDIGDVYDVETSTFTAPVDGIYSFNATVKTSVEASSRYLCRFNIAGNDNYRFFDGNGGNGGGTASGSVSGIKLDKGDQVFVEAWTSQANASVLATYGFSWFSGRLLSLS